MYLYYFLFILPPLLFALDKPFRENTKYIFVVLLFIALMVGLRAPGVDRDYSAYLASYFDNLYPLEQIFTSPNFGLKEPGMLILGSFIKNTLSMPVYIIFVFIILFAVCLKLKSFNDLLPDLFPLVTIVYFCNFFLLHEMTQIRIGLAAAFYYWSIRNILDGDFKGYIKKNLIGVIFHYSAVIFIITFFFVNRRNISKGIILFFTIVLTIIVLIPLFFLLKGNNFLLLLRLTTYFSGIYTSGTINFFNPLVLFRVILLFLLFFYKKRDKSDKMQSFLVIMNTVGIFTFYGLFFLPVFSLRLSQLFFIVDPIAIPTFLYSIFKRNEAKILIIITSLLFYFCNIYYMNLVGPFKFVLF